MITRDRDTGEYFVVFRGTNPISSTEWIFQDFMVLKQVPWVGLSPGLAPPEALISEGAAAAVALRLSLEPAEGLPGAGIPLGEALIGLAAGPADRRVAHFTGHSLGGLLAPVMALWLQDRLGEPGRGVPAPSLEIDVYGYAAPTAGNRAFAAYLESRIPRHLRYANELDVVTHAWESSAMEALPSLYEPTIRMDPVIRSMYGIASGLAKGGNYAQPGESLPVAAGVVPVKRGMYLLEAVYQHCVPYLNLLEPERKERILNEVYMPLAKLVSVKGMKPFDLRALFREGR